MSYLSRLLVLGAISAIACAPFAAATPFTTYSCWNGGYYSLDLDTGDATLIPSTPAFWHLDFAPDGTLYGVSRSSDELYRFIDPAAGTAVSLGALPVPSTGSGITVSPDGAGVYYTVGSGRNELYRYNTAAGTTDSLGTINLPIISDIEFAPDGVLYAIDGHSFANKRLYTIDLNTLDATAVGPALFGLTMDARSIADSIDFAPDGTLYTTIDPTQYTGLGDQPDTYLATLDPLTGLATLDLSTRIHVGGTFYHSDTLAIEPNLIPDTAAIPEPSTVVLMGLGLVGLGYAGRRKVLN